MPRAPCSFTESEMRRAIKAAHSAGVEIARVEISKKGFAIIPGKPTDEPAAAHSEPEDLRELL
jgi:hypothetical protein